MLSFSRPISSRCRRISAARRSRRRCSSTRLAGLERLEAKTPLAVDVSLSDGLLTLTYSASTDNATLTVSGDTFTVTGNAVTSVTGTTTGSWSSSINVVCGYFPINVFPATTSGFTLSSTASVSLGSLTVGGPFGEPPANVTIATPVDAAVVADGPSIADPEMAIFIEAVDSISISGGLTAENYTLFGPWVGIYLSAWDGSVAVGGAITTDDGAVFIQAGGSISYASIDAHGGEVTIDQNESSISSTGAISSAVAAAAATSSAAPVIRAGRTVGGTVSIQADSAAIQLAGDVIASGDATFDGPVSLMQPIRVDSSAGGGDVTFSSTVDGRHPLAVAAGTGAVAFQGVVGGTKPLAGLRFESAASVTAAGRVNLSGGVARGFRQGIEIAPGVNNVTMTQGGTIRNFRSGQAIHIPGGTTGSTIRGFRIVNSGTPFLGYGSYAGTTISGNTVVSPVSRATSGRITTRSGGTNTPTPTISGRASSGDTVTLYADGVPVGSTVAFNGGWSIFCPGVAAGLRSFTVRALGANGVARAPVGIRLLVTPGVV